MLIILLINSLMLSFDTLMNLSLLSNVYIRYLFIIHCFSIEMKF